MVAGGLAVSSKRVEEINDFIRELRETANISEFHWSEYRGGHRRAAYEKLVDYAFSLIRDKKAELHIIIANFKGYNHKRAPGENRDTSISRMYWQLALHRLAPYYGKSRAIHMRLDNGNDCKGICAMRNQICAASYYEHDTKPNCFRSITPVCSSKSGLIQMSDVLIGAVAAKRNQVIHSAKNEKGPLADFVSHQAFISDWSIDTPRGARGITVWNHKGSLQVPPSPI